MDINNFIFSRFAATDRKLPAGHGSMYRVRNREKHIAFQKSAACLSAGEHQRKKVFY